MTRVSICSQDPCLQGTYIHQGVRLPSDNEQMLNCNCAKCLGKGTPWCGNSEEGNLTQEGRAGYFPEDVAETLRSEE